jgi:hypothetical protein
MDICLGQCRLNSSQKSLRHRFAGIRHHPHRRQCRPRPLRQGQHHTRQGGYRREDGDLLAHQEQQQGRAQLAGRAEDHATAADESEEDLVEAVIERQREQARDPVVRSQRQPLLNGGRSETHIPVRRHDPFRTSRRS